MIVTKWLIPATLFDLIGSIKIISVIQIILVSACRLVQISLALFYKTILIHQNIHFLVLTVGKGEAIKEKMKATRYNATVFTFT